MLKFTTLLPSAPKFTLTPKVSIPSLVSLPKAKPVLLPTFNAPQAFTMQSIPGAPVEDADAGAGSGVSGVKIAVGLGVAALVVGAIVIATRSKSAVPNAQSQKCRVYKTSSKKREYMKGYRAGRKFCG